MLCSLETEQTLIGCALQDQSCAEAISILPDDVFYYAETREVHRIIREILKEHGEPNLVSIQQRAPEQLPNILKISETGMRLAVTTTMYSTIEREALDLWKRRKLKEASEKVLQSVADSGTDVDKLSEIMTTAANESAKQDEDMSMGQVVHEFLDYLDQKKSTVIGTGIAGLDKITEGFQGGQLVVLGARPKVGKTALGLSIVTNVARKYGPVLINSLEMTPKELFDRMMASESNVDMKRIVMKKLEGNDYELMARHYGEMVTWPIHFSKLKTPLAVRRKASEMKRNGGLSLIMLDYLQLMKADGKTNSRYEAVSEISREMKLLAMDLDVPILALTQFNRESEAGGTKSKPTMAQARDSGSIEQDANMFLIQYAPPEPKAGSELFEYWAACQRNGTELQMLEVAANRQGPTGNVLMQFDKSHMRFTTLMKERAV